MVEEVIKKNGEVEGFIKEKIVVSAIEAGAEYRRAKKIADKIKNKFKDQETVKTSDIRSTIIKELLNEKDIIPQEKLANCTERISEIEEELKDRASYGASEILLISFKNTDEVNKFTNEIGKKQNIKIKEINHIKDKYVIEIKIRPPTQSLY
ncbi:hypothetical protein C9439_05210 [archaeon SCG-AAA382B04]|nr:hypothetical protein C9439_05210 [archaeon SCG-AAA382B04]